MLSSRNSKSTLKLLQIHILPADVATLCRALGDEDLDGLDHDDEVLNQAVVLDVHEVVDEFVVRGGVVLGEDLGEAGDAGLDVVAVGVLGVLRGELLDEVRALGARADEAHVAVEDVPDLRQFVEAGGADEGADARDARVVVGRELRAREFLGVDAHRAELVDLVGPAEAAGADLAVEGRAAVFELDGDGDGHHERQGEDEGDAREHDVDGALDGALFDAQAQAARTEDGHVVDALQHGAIAEDLVGARDDEGLDLLVGAVVDDLGLDGDRDVGANDNDVDIVQVGLFAPVLPAALRVHDDLVQLKAELRLGAHAVVDVAALLLIADDHGAAAAVQALLVALGEALPEAEQEELQDGADDDQHARVGKLVDEEAQGHDHGEHEEEADGEADEDLAEALVLNGVEAVDGEHHDGQDDGDRQHAGVEHGVRLERTRRDDEYGAEAVGDRDDRDVADEVEYLTRFRVDARLHGRIVPSFIPLIYRSPIYDFCFLCFSWFLS